MSTQLHKNFTDEQVRLLLKSYLDKKIKINYIFKCLELKVPSAPLHELLGAQIVKNSELNLVQF